MIVNKIDCITFFQENFMFDIRFNILKDCVDKFIVCESKYDHLGRPKKLNFNLKKFNNKKIIYVVYENKFPNNNPWKNQAIQREFLLSATSEFKNEDYIFFSDPDEIPNPEKVKNLKLKKMYGIFLQDCFNYKFNLFNHFESPWEGTRVSMKKNLKSIDFMRQKILSKNINYPFWRIDKVKSIEIINDGGWHFNNLLSPEEISKKLQSFAHTEFSDSKYSSAEVIKNKIEKCVDLFNRGHKYTKKNDLSYLPNFILNNIEDYKDFIIN